MRRKLVMGNWKMNGSLRANETLVSSLLGLLKGGQKAEIALAPPNVYLAQVGELLSSESLVLAAQDMSAHENLGAYTGEVSGSMLVDLGCQYVIVGHSERRAYHAEHDDLVAAKVLAGFAAGLKPVVCVGESLAEREAGSALAVIDKQLKAVLKVVDIKQLNNLVVAYEPVWAIGTGKTASPEQAQEVHQFIRSRLGGQANEIQILYGGSVKAANAASLFAQPDIDGALVGGAALDAEEFFQICQAAG